MIRLRWICLSIVIKMNFKTWDQSLAPMNDAQAQEIKTFVDDQIVKERRKIIKKQDLFMIGLRKNVRYAGSNDTDIGLAPYDVFTKKVAVCGGYSNLYKAMLNAAGIPAIYVIGWAGGQGHAWNLVYADGKLVFILILHGEFPILTTILAPDVK